MGPNEQTAEQISAARSAAGKLGAQAVKATFGTVITRRRFAELIEVSPSTIRRWELAGLIEPRMEEILKSPTTVFSADDVEFGRRLIALLRKESGKITLKEAARSVRQGLRSEP